ncbi:hypothetical protein AmaxDRAFT_2223 [Limnospira maxima CS-328]|uniref:Insertion element IS150 protein InsJ-like helix-turn-helix domain-containing protein n=1 Tax=Limnospira maxima CS-328 TaxID=513049 RepID=B5W0C9_LIMMA|nr:hypothetical protein AmaxDRAFT_2223 [Limnospira maxima CS-328]
MPWQRNAQRPSEQRKNQPTPYTNYSLYTKHKVRYNVWLLYKLSQPTTMSRYSLDFRKKIVEAYEKGDTSIRKVAKRFLVSPDTVRRLVKQYRLTGDLSPRKCGTKKKSI